MFSAKHSFADMKECNAKKETKFCQKWGVVCPNARGGFLVIFLVIWCVFFVSLCLVFLFCTRPQKLFSCNFGFFAMLFPQKACFKILFFFLFCFFLFSFCHPFQNSSFYLCVLSMSPVLEHIFLGVYFVYFFLPFPFLMFACFFNKLS